MLKLISISSVVGGAYGLSEHMQMQKYLNKFICIQNTILLLMKCRKFWYIERLLYTTSSYKPQEL